MIVSIVETFNGVRAVQAFRREKRNDAIFADLNTHYRDTNRETFTLQAYFIPGTALIGNVATVVVLLVGGFRVASGGLELGVLTSFLLYLRQFYDPMEDVGMFYNSLQSATAALDKIAAVLAEPPSVAEPEPTGAAAGTGARRAVAVVGHASPTAPTGRCCTSSISTSRPARPSRWSAPPARARPPSPS